MVSGSSLWIRLNDPVWFRKPLQQCSIFGNLNDRSIIEILINKLCEKTTLLILYNWSMWWILCAQLRNHLTFELLEASYTCYQPLSIECNL